MIKVCHMTSVHGAEDVRIFHKECVSLAQAGYEVCLVQCGNSYEKDGVRLVGAGPKPSSRLKRMTSYGRRVYKKALALDAEIYHLHDPELLPYGLKLKRKGKKVVFDSHEIYTLQIPSKSYLPKWVSRVVAWAYAKYEKYALRHLDAVVVPCTVGGRNPFEGLCKRVVYVDNTAMLGELYDKYDLRTAKVKRQVCYIGVLTESRGITLDVKAAHKAGAKLVLAGQFSSEEYKKRLESMPEFTSVEYRGLLGRDGVKRLIEESEVGLAILMDSGQNYLTDNLLTKVYEYMSLGVPVVISNSRYNNLAIQKHKFGLCVNPDDIDQTAAAIRYLLDNPDEARKMGENGRKAVREEFNWGIEEKKLLALYDDILNGKR